MSNPEGGPITVMLMHPDPDLLHKLASMTYQIDDQIIVRTTTSIDNPSPILESFIPDVIVTDFVCESTPLFSMIQNLKEKYPSSKLIVASSQESISDAIQVMKLGADDYVVIDNQFTETFQRSILAQIGAIRYQKNITSLRENIFYPDSFPIILYKASENGIDYVLRDFDTFPDALSEPFNVFVQKLGLSILVSIGQGHQYPEGCYTLPAASASNYIVMVFTFRTPDSNAVDPRLRMGYFLMVLFVPKIISELLPSTAELEFVTKLLKQTFVSADDISVAQVQMVKDKLLQTFSTFKNNH